MSAKVKSIGLKLEYPKQECQDNNCPFHGHLKIKKRQFVGTIVSAKMHRTAVVEWDWKHYLPKFERYEKRRTRIKVHNPDCIKGIEGEIVRVYSCRPLSKTKNFVIVERLGKEKGFIEKIEAREEAKVAEKISKEDKENQESEVKSE